MSTLKFSDGMTINMEGQLRIIRKSDGLYVVGDGMCLPVESRQEGRETIAELTPTTEDMMADGEGNGRGPSDFVAESYRRGEHGSAYLNGSTCPLYIWNDSSSELGGTIDADYVIVNDCILYLRDLTPTAEKQGE